MGSSSHDSDAPSSEFQGRLLSERAIEKILAVIAGSNNFDELPSQIANACAKVFEADFCSIWRIQVDDRQRRSLCLAGASDGMRLPETIAQEATYVLGLDPEGSDADGITGFIAQTKQSVTVGSFKELRERYGHAHSGKIDPFQYENDAEHRFKNFCGVPVICGNNVVGVLKIENLPIERGVNQWYLEALQDVATAIAVAVHSLMLLDRHGQRIIDAVIELSTTLAQASTPDVSLQRIVDTTAQILDAEMCSLWLVEPDRQSLRLKAYRGFIGSTDDAPTYALNWEAKDDKQIDGLTAWIAVREKEFWAHSYEELRKHPSFRGASHSHQWGDGGKQGFRCFFGLPLRVTGQVCGVLKVDNKKGAPYFSESDMTICRLMASYVAVAVELGQKVRRELLTDLSHVIRSPIAQAVTSLFGLESELAKETPEIERCKVYVQILKRMFLSIDGQARSLALLAQPGEITADREDVDLGRVFDRQVEAINNMMDTGREFRRMGWRKVTVRLSPREQTLVEMLTYNVLHNALKYSPAESPVEIEMTQDENGNVVIGFEDHGIGISAADLPRVFEQGFRRREEGWPEGTGMGLAGVQNAVIALGWEVKLRSRLGKGTRLSIIIPAEKVIDA